MSKNIIVPFKWYVNSLGGSRTLCFREKKKKGQGRKPKQNSQAATYITRLYIFSKELDPTKHDCSELHAMSITFQTLAGQLQEDAIHLLTHLWFLPHHTRLRAGQLLLLSIQNCCWGRRAARRKRSNSPVSSKHKPKSTGTKRGPSKQLAFGKCKRRFCFLPP